MGSEVIKLGGEREKGGRVVNNNLIWGGGAQNLYLTGMGPQ